MLKEKYNTNWNFWNVKNEENKVTVNLPHDAMLTEERVPDLEGGVATGFFPGGKYIYTKKIFGKPEFQNKTIILEFEGIYMKSKVYLNDEEVGGWIYGYTNFYIDLSDKLLLNQENELKVVVDNSQTPNSRWYSGSGIYRDVNLMIAERSYIVPDGVQIKTLTYNPAEVEISIETVMEPGMDITFDILYKGDIVAQGNGNQCQLSIPSARLWDAESPNLYEIRVFLKKDKTIVDEATQSFGIRKIEWNATDGLMINGKAVKLRGGCVHHDHGPLGACSYEKAEYRRAKILKELGYNAVRYSHYPSNRAFLKVCDEIGLYVFDETFDQWQMPQSTYDYAMYFDKEWKRDVEALIRKDYNHPCVIMYCIGNEITDTAFPNSGKISKQLNEFFHQLDDTRPTTIAINGMLSVLALKMAEEQSKASSENEKYKHEQKKDEVTGSNEVNDWLTLLPKIRESITAESLEQILKDCISHVDIVGYNYGENLYEGIHKLAPDRVIVSSETFPSKIGDNWSMVQSTPYVIGDFMWTAWDYLGEAGVGLPVYGTKQGQFTKEYPCLSAGCGSVDMTGFVESQGYYVAVLWGKYKKPYIGVRPVDHAGEDVFLGLWRLTDAISSWTWPGQEGKTAVIEVYSIGDSVELLQDGVSTGKKKLEQAKVIFEVDYHPGTLEAISYDTEGKEIERSTLKTAAKDTKLTILPEEMSVRANGEDLLYVPIHITDDKGITKMLMDRNVTVEVKGAGALIAVGSGNPETTEHFSDNSYTTYYGRMIAIIRSNGEKGKIKITAHADGLIDESIEVLAK